MHRRIPETILFACSVFAVPREETQTSYIMIFQSPRQLSDDLGRGHISQSSKNKLVVHASLKVAWYRNVTKCVNYELRRLNAVTDRFTVLLPSRTLVPLVVRKVPF